MTKISVLGLGSMGSAIASCLIKNGYDVCVWNRSPEKVEPLVAEGAKAAGTPGEAAAASPLIIVCIKSHRETGELLEPLGANLAGKTVCDLSTGDTADADRLVALLQAQGADFMLGMINAYPSGIGNPDTTVLTVGSQSAWSSYGDVIRALGGGSAYVGHEPSALAALFAGLFTVRQGFMFGMIYGALVCRKAGIPMQVFSNQIPASIKLVHDYHKVFADTVPEGNFENPEASMKVYALALEDALNTFKSVGAPADFAQLMFDRAKAALDDGLGEKQLTALVEHMLD